MDICLIYLPKPFLREPDAQSPLGLMYIASALERDNISTMIKNYASFSDKEAIIDLPEAMVYGITVTSLELLHANRFSKMIKRKFKSCKIILGGPGTCTPEFINWNFVDSICKGEGEEIISTIVQDVKLGKLKKHYLPQPIKDINNLAPPARHMIKNKLGGNIFAWKHNYIQGGSTVILSSRGCPFKCSFCASPMLTYRYRLRSIQSITDEIKDVIAKYNIKQFRFSDDMFTANKDHVLKLCDALGELNIAWRISCRVKPLDNIILKNMQQAGCRELSLGVESFDNVVLSGLNKKTTQNDNIKALELAHKYNINTRVLLMIRTPFQTPETIKINKHWLRRLPFTIIACTAFIPIPGCDVWYNPNKYNVEILNKDLDKYNFYMFNPSGKQALLPIIKIKNRPLNEYIKESEDFIDWLDNLGMLNKG